MVKEHKEFAEYLDGLVQDGYITEEGKPLKCLKCESKDFEMINEYYCPYGLEEYQLKCKSCDSIVGHWAFGYWQV